jgi:plasmid stabilization system protein ParE
MKEYVLSTGAELDLGEIWEYIAHDNINAADRWTGKLFDAFEAIASRICGEFPLEGAQCLHGHPHPNQDPFRPRA